MSDAEVDALLAQAHEAKIERIVVAALLWNNGVLLLRRKRDDFLGSLWEIPSGKLEIGESIHDGLRREVLEETGLIVENIGRYVGSFDYSSKSGKRTRQLTFEATLQTWCTIELSEHDSCTFVRTRDELARFNVSPELSELLGHVFP